MPPPRSILLRPLQDLQYLIGHRHHSFRKKRFGRCVVRDLVGAAKCQRVKLRYRAGGTDERIIEAKKRKRSLPAGAGLAAG
jgi:hypothetical protein